MWNSQIQMLLPEIILLASVILAMFVMVFSERKAFFVSCSGLVLAFVFLLKTFHFDLPAQVDGIFIVDGLSQFLKSLLVFTTLISATMCAFSKEIEKNEKLEVLILTILATLFGCIVVSAANFIPFFLASAGVGLSYVYLVASKRYSRVSVEASLKCFVNEAVIIGLLFVGIALLVSFSQSLNFMELKTKLATADTFEIRVWTGFALILLYGLSRSMLFPFHFQTPDLVQGSPIISAAFYICSSTIVGASVLIRICLQIFSVKQESLWITLGNVQWNVVLEVIAVLSMTLGNLLAFRQKNVKRMLGYFCISQAGFLFLGFAVLNFAGLSATLFTILTVVLDLMGAFFVLQGVIHRDQNEEFDILRGMVWKKPFEAVCLCVFFLSLCGIPPFVGFVSRFYIVGELVKQKKMLLAGACTLNWLIMFSYFLFLIVQIFFKKERNDAPEKFSIRSLELVPRIALVGLLLPTILLGIYWDFFMHHVSNSLNHVLW